MKSLRIKCILILCTLLVATITPTITQANSLEIPEEVLEIFPEADFIELISYEVQYQGGGL